MEEDCKVLSYKLNENAIHKNPRSVINMAHSHASRIQEYIGEPVSDSPEVDRDTLEEICQDIQAVIRYDH